MPRCIHAMRLRERFADKRFAAEQQRAQDEARRRISSIYSNAWLAHENADLATLYRLGAGNPGLGFDDSPEGLQRRQPLGWGNAAYNPAVGRADANLGNAVGVDEGPGEAVEKRQIAGAVPAPRNIAVSLRNGADRLKQILGRVLARKADRA